MDQATQAAERLPLHGEMAAIIRARDRAGTTLGPAETRPERFRAVVDLVAESPRPSCLICGPERDLSYNDEAARRFGERHPEILGRPPP